MPQLDHLLWRCHREAAALLRDLAGASGRAPTPMALAGEYIAVLNRHIEPLREAIEAVERRERDDGEREDRSYRGIWGDAS